MPRLARLIAIGLVAWSASPLAAQSLRGSRESVERMHRYAVARDFRFLVAADDVRVAVRRGTLVRLVPTRDYRLHRVPHPYARPATRLFVERLAAQYHDRCGAPLVVTSAVRPAADQPANSIDESVHPTGIAIDLRKPAGPCRDWLRDLLLSLERIGVLEATEEFSPPHFHVAVFDAPYERYVARRAAPRADRARAAANE